MRELGKELGEKRKSSKEKEVKKKDIEWTIEVGNKGTYVKGG